MNWNRNEWQGRSQRQVENNNKSQFAIIIIVFIWLTGFGLFNLFMYIINWLKQL